MFLSLPNKVVTYTFEFLDIKDISSVSCVSKQFHKIINDHNKFWTRECFRQYISFDLEAYSEIYAEEKYKSWIKQRVFSLPKGSWKKLLEEGITNRKNFGAVLKQITYKDRVDVFLNYLDEIILQPPLPMATLKRETIIASTQTIFQTKLSEVLYEDSTCVSKGRPLIDEFKDVIDGLKENEKEILLQSFSCNKDELLRARWSLFESKDEESEETLSDGDHINDFPELPTFSKNYKISNATTDNAFLLLHKTSPLLKLYNCLYNLLSHYCKILSNYLDTVENVYDLLAEYTSRWNTFVCTMLELERLFETFSELMNKNYEAVFEGYPSYPKFSIWRMMTKIWMKEIFEKDNFKLVLNESFLRVLSNHREKNIKQALNNNSINMHFNDIGKYSELPKCLYVGLKVKRKKNSSIRYQSYEKLSNTPHACFGELMDSERQLIQSFIQSILDISLNEVKIHYLDCSDIPTNYPYRELEDCFLMKSNEFYTDYQHLFHESPDYFCHFLKSDCSLLSEVLNERTNIKLENIQVQNGLQFMKNFISHQLSTINECEFKEKCTHFTPFENTELSQFIENCIQNVVFEITQEEEKASDFYKLPKIEMEEESDCCDTDQNGLLALCSQYKNDINFIKKLAIYFIENFADFKSNFEYLKQKLEHFESIKLRDSQIKEDNLSKNIPYELGDVDCLFYDLEKNIRIDLLQKLFEDYQEFVQQQSKENSTFGMEEELPDLQLPGLGDRQNFMPNPNNEINGDLFNDPGDIDLMNLGSLPLRRNPF